MKRLFAVVTVMSLLVMASGCARTAPTLAPASSASRPAEARLFDRFEAEVANDARTGLACLTITAKGLATRFEDADFTVVQTLDAADEAQRVLFNSPLFLGEDGFLYLRETIQGRPAGQFYRAGAYGEPGRAGGSVAFKLSGGLKLEARNRSLLPIHGSGPYIAVVAEELPAPAPQAPQLLRGN